MRPRTSPRKAADAYLAGHPGATAKEVATQCALSPRTAQAAVADFRRSRGMEPVPTGRPRKPPPSPKTPEHDGGEQKDGSPFCSTLLQSGHGR